MTDTEAITETTATETWVPPSGNAPVSPAGSAGSYSIDLASPRWVHFTDRGKEFSLKFRIATFDDWRTFFSQIRLEISKEGDGRKLYSGTRNAQMDLAAALLIGSRGYNANPIPPQHLLLAGQKLSDVAVAEIPWTIEEPSGEFVGLEATWCDDGSSTMIRYAGGDLVHVFTPPELAHWRKYNRAIGDSIQVGGTRDGRTIIPSRYALLVELYDELIVSVGGYRYHEEPLTGTQRIKSHMDGCHKFAAASALFREVEESDAAPEAAA